MFIFIYLFIYLSGNKGEEVINSLFTPHFSLRISVQITNKLTVHFVFYTCDKQEVRTVFHKAIKLNP